MTEPSFVAIQVKRMHVHCSYFAPAEHLGTLAVLNVQSSSCFLGLAGEKIEKVKISEYFLICTATYSESWTFTGTGTKQSC